MCSLVCLLSRFLKNVRWRPAQPLRVPPTCHISTHVHHSGMDLHRYASADTKYKKEDNGAQVKSFPDPIVLFIYDVNFCHPTCRSDVSMRSAICVMVVCIGLRLARGRRCQVTMIRPLSRMIFRATSRRVTLPFMAWRSRYLCASPSVMPCFSMRRAFARLT